MIAPAQPMVADRPDVGDGRDPAGRDDRSSIETDETLVERRGSGPRVGRHARWRSPRRSRRPHRPVRGSRRRHRCRRRRSSSRVRRRCRLAHRSRRRSERIRGRRPGARRTPDPRGPLSRRRLARPRPRACRRLRSRPAGPPATSTETRSPTAPTIAAIDVGMCRDARPRPIEVDDVEPPRPAPSEPDRHGHGIDLVGGLAVEVALLEVARRDRPAGRSRAGSRRSLPSPWCHATVVAR